MANIMAAHILIKLDHTYLSNLMSIETQCHQFPMSEKLMLSCLSGRYSAYGCFNNDELIAFYIVEQVGPDYTLTDICVSPNYQGTGLAKKMLNHLLASVRNTQGENVFLEVRESNQNAIGLYNCIGFVEVGIRKGYYPSHNGREDAILMALTV